MAIFLNIRFYFDGRKYTADENFFQFWTSFSNFFEEVILCVPVLKTSAQKGFFEVNQKKVKICPFPYYEGPFNLYKNFVFFIPKLKKIVSDNISDWDIIGAVIPNIMGLSLVLQAKSYLKPSFIYLRGNHKKVVRYEFQRGFKKILAWPTVSILDLLIKRIINNTLTFTLGKELYHKYKRDNNFVFNIVTSIVSDKDIRKKIPKRVNASETIKLLYVGRLSPEKGIRYLIDSLSQLTKEIQFKISLTIVGSGSEELTLRKKAKKLRLNHCTTFLGYVPYGSELIKLYQDSHIFILPSLTEGVPLVLTEAMARGVPIIATSVGGVPDIIKDGKNGLLVPPANSQAIAEAVLRLMNDGELRIKLIKNALKTVKEYTLEKQRDRTVNILESHFGLELRR